VNILALDFETYYDADYSLRKLTNEEYIRDPRFEVIMVSLKMNDRPAIWVPAPQVRSIFGSLPWADLAVLSHNSFFDMSILGWRYGIHPGFILDSLCMFRALFPAESASLENMAKVLGLPEKGHEVLEAKGKHFADFSPTELAAYGGYSVKDSEIARGAFDILKKDFPMDELRLVDLTTRLCSEPILQLDKPLLEEAQADELERKAKLLDKIGADKKMIGSNGVFAQLLINQGVDPPKKVSVAWRKKNPKVDAGDPPTGLIPAGDKIWGYAFSQGDEVFKGMLGSDNEVLRALVEARFGVKSAITETRLGRLLGIAGRGTLPIELTYYGAHTGRFGGSGKINPQNLTRACSNEGCDGGKVNEG
jgi:hypothetical protein